MSIFGFLNRKLRFTKKFYSALKTNIDDIQLISIKELEVKVRHEDNVHTHYLDNAYSEYRQDDQDAEEVIERYIMSCKEMYISKFAFSIDKVVPYVKDINYVDELKEIAGSEKIDFVYEKYNDELYIFYIQDLENSISFLKEDDIIEYGINTNNLLSVATNNLMNILPNLEKHGENGYYMIVAGGNYEASLILESSIWNQENFPVEGEFIIGIPSRDVLLITGSKDQLNIMKMRSIVTEINHTGAHVISDKLFIYKNDKFEIFEE